MTFRMLCMDCGNVSVPETWLDGSDRVEWAGWLCLALPGLLYCAWRHLGREKRCAHCGSGALMRESRASAARHRPMPAPPDPPRVKVPHTALVWPEGLSSPRERLHSGASASWASALALGAWLLALLGLAPPAFALALAALGWLHGGLWAARQARRMAQLRDRLGACEAWDQSGRRLPINLV